MSLIIYVLLVNANAIVQPWYSHEGGVPYKGPKAYIPLAYSLYYYNIFPVYLQPIYDYVIKSDPDRPFPIADSPYDGFKANVIMKNCKKEDIKIFPQDNDLGIVFLIYLSSILYGHFFPAGVLMLHIIIYLSILLFLFHSFWREKMVLVGLLTCLILAANSYIVTFFYQSTFRGVGYPALGAILIFAILLPIIINRPIPEKELWFRIIYSGVAFFIFTVIRCNTVFILFSILFFVLIYGNISKYKRFIRVVITLFILVIPYFSYSGLVTHLRYYYHSKFQLPDTQDNYSGAYHAIWHGVYCGLGDFGEDKGFKWLDESAQNYVHSVKPGISSDYEAEYEIILREKVFSTIWENPVWYLKILFLRFERIFWDKDAIVGAFFRNLKTYAWTIWIYRISLFVFFFCCVFLKKYKELNMFLFFIPTVFTGLFITTAATYEHYQGVIVLYFLPFVFVISFLSQLFIGGVVKITNVTGLFVEARD